ncbi:MAG: NADH-quinone oxidoreductase subunit H [Thermoplasmata archaeon]|nr:NADH-quinone oxidoreductase subunit H [Thermoplasmata archaeon]
MILNIVLILITPLIGLLLMGLDRKISARMQNRKGPPLAQPLYDLIKLFSKKEEYVNTSTIVFALTHLIFMVATVVLFFLLQDLIVIFFTLTLSIVFLILGGFSTRSPYSYLGSHRELMQLLAIETLFLMIIVTIGVSEGSFSLEDIIAGRSYPLFFTLPLSFAALFLVVIVKMGKPPFDIPSAHSEVVQGPYTEYSGRWYAVFQISKMFEVPFFFAIFVVFFMPFLLVGLIVAAFLFFLSLLVGNTTSRTTYKGMLKFTYLYGIPLVLVNLAGLMLL